MNQGIVLIKPHAYSDEFLQECLAHLKEAGVYVVNGFPLTCTTQMADKHYKSLEQYSREIPKNSSFVSMEQYRKDHPDLSAAELCARWRQGMQLAVDKDYYVSKIGDDWVSNGFYAFMREDFDNRKAFVLVVSFSFPFSRFKKEVIGCTNAAKAPTTTLRGLYYAKYCTPSTDLCRNGVHASADALEGFRDCMIWANIPKESTMLYKKMRYKPFLERYLRLDSTKEIDEVYGGMDIEELIESVEKKDFFAQMWGGSN